MTVCGRNVRLLLIESAYEPSGQSVRSLSRFLWHEAARSISTSPLDERLIHRWVNPSIKFASTRIYTPVWMDRGTVNVLPKSLQ